MERYDRSGYWSLSSLDGQKEENWGKVLDARRKSFKPDGKNKQTELSKTLLSVPVLWTSTVSSFEFLYTIFINSFEFFLCWISISYLLTNFDVW